MQRLRCKNFRKKIALQSLVKFENYFLSVHWMRLIILDSVYFLVIEFVVLSKAQVYFERDEILSSREAVVVAAAQVLTCPM